MRAAAVTSGWVSFNCLCLTCYRCQTWQDAVTLRASSAASRFRRYEPARLQRSRLHYAPNTYYSACLTYFNYHLPPSALQRRLGSCSNRGAATTLSPLPPRPLAACAGRVGPTCTAGPRGPGRKPGPPPLAAALRADPLTVP